MEKLLSYRALSAVSGVPVGTLRHMVATGELPCVKLNQKLVLFAPSQVRRALAKYQVGAGDKLEPFT
jgi:hypothetical protein